MKLNQFITRHATSQVIQQFGEAKLIRHDNGRHELIGGSASDVTAANEWVSLFAHDIVFHQPQRAPKLNCRRRKSFPARFQPFV